MPLYTLLLSTGLQVTYAPDKWAPNGPWVYEGMGYPARWTSPAVTADDHERCAAIIRQYEADHAPQYRVRVATFHSVKACVLHERVHLFSNQVTDADARAGRFFDLSMVPLTAEFLAVCNSLFAHPRERSDDRGESWTPCA